MVLFLVALFALTGCGGSGATDGQDRAVPNQSPGRVEQPGPTFSVVDQKELLTVEDIEPVSGFQGVQPIGYNPAIWAGGDLNFALADGEIFLMAEIKEASMYDRWRDEFFHATVGGLGVEVFNGPPQGYQHVLFFRSGGRAYSLSSFFNLDDGGKPYLTQEQLISLAETMLSRI